MVYKTAEGRSLGGSLALTAVDRFGVSANRTEAGYGMVDLSLERRLSSRTSALFSVRSLLDKEHPELSTRIGNQSEDKAIYWGRDAFFTLRFDL